MNAASPPPSRWLHLYTPRLPTDRLRREQAELSQETACALTAKVKNALRLTAVDAAAARLGLEPGLTLKEARRRVPDLETYPYDPAADAVLAGRLLALCRRVTPAVARDGALGFVLNVTGAGHLHGGEAVLAERLAARFAQVGVEVRWALAGTPGLAWACALFAAGGVIPVADAAAALAPLPVEALRLNSEDTADLRALGFKRIGAVLERPRSLFAAPLEGRLGARLDVILGEAPCAVARALERPSYLAERTLAEPITGVAAVLGWTRRLAEALEPQLLARGRGARALELTLIRIDGSAQRIGARAHRPRTDPAGLTRLFEGPLEALVEPAEADASMVGREIETLRLEARLTAPLNPSTPDLIEPRHAADRFEAFTESLSARLGHGAVEVLRADPHTQKPEREVRFAALGTPPPSAAPAAPPPAWNDRALRPLRLFDPPQPIEVIAGLPDDPPATLVWRRIRRRVVKAEGPERLAPEWGREPADTLTRDYYRVEDDQGRRYWVFREGLAADPQRCWRLHGLFA